MKETRDRGSSRVVTKRGTPLPLFFVSAESKRLKFSVSSLECAVVRGPGTADCKGLAGAAKSGTSLLARELTEEAGRGAVSREKTTATIAKVRYHKAVLNASIKFTRWDFYVERQCRQALE